MKQDDIAILLQAIEKWGEESQIGMAIEEAAELIVALRKLSRVGGREIKEGAADAVIDEIADVTIMMHQMSLIFGPDKVQARIRHKLDRLEKRINPTAP